MASTNTKAVEGQVKILAESLNENAPAVFGTDEEVEKYIDLVIEGTTREIPSSLVRAGKPVSMRLVSRDFDPDYQEFSVDVESTNWERALFVLVNNFFMASKRFRRETNRADIVSIMQCSNFNLLKREFLPVDSGIAAEFFCLGNLMNPFRFINHFKLNEEHVNLQLLNECERLNNNTHGILVDFEHDRNMLKVKFGYSIPPTKTSHEFQNACVYIHVMYSSIRRIIVDWDELDGNDLEGVKVYLHLNCPVEIKKSKKKYHGFQMTERFLSWDRNTVPPKAISDCPVLMVAFKRISKAQLYNCLSRLRARCNVVLEFCNVQTDTAVPYVSAPMDDEMMKWVIVRHNCYGLGYLIEALSSRGAIVNDHLMTSLQNRNNFINKVLATFEKDKRVALVTLERMLNTLDEHLEIRNLNRVFDKILEMVETERLAIAEEEEAHKKNGFQRVRKVVITPTRKLLVVPELLMGNRFLRTRDETGDQTLRIQFRDDDSQHMRRNKCGSFLIQRTVGGALRDGVVVAGRLYKYMGSSNSQMRDNGCYFFNAETAENIHEQIRSQFGKFDTDNIPKFMSRFGQCFTQAKKCNVKLQRGMYGMIPEVTGGDEENAFEAYTFSDGVGNISEAYAKKVSKDLDLRSCVPSVFQVRFRGIKGIVSVNPYLDYAKSFVNYHQLKQESKHNRIDVDLAFRPSQEKFRAPRDNGIEIVKHSSPVPLCLNRPMINIMDQVTAMQNPATHKRMCARVHQFLDIQLDSLVGSLTDEGKAQDRLSQLARRIDCSFLSVLKGFLLTEEPFFRSLLQTLAKYTLRKILAKNQVQVPPQLGRCLFGVIDESGILQHGQIFCQITANIFTKLPGKSCRKEILTGKVLMTKNPAIAAGDIRMFDAVDVPELRHLVDVVVFPRYGPRPHPDEMAGSDLDGDEYVVIWDPDLYFDHNEKPSVFPKPLLEHRQDGRDINTKMIDFYVSYIEQDTIGTISTAHLAQSDQHGIKSPVANSIALKHSFAVDFPKTGNPPKPLTHREMNGIPPERPEWFPDFMKRSNRPSYVSSGLNGQLFRRGRDIDDVLTQALDRQSSLKIEEDPDLSIPGYEKYMEVAKADAAAYNSSMSALLDNYGIADEAEAFTGMILKCRNRISDRDGDDMSLFNTNYVIEHRVNRIFSTARRHFFEEFGGYEYCTEEDAFKSTKKFSPVRLEDNDLDRRFCKYPTTEMMMKACAYYKAGYKLAQKADRRFLSFAWVCWDILAEVKRENHFHKAVKDSALTGTPLNARLNTFIMNFAAHEHNLVEFYNCKDELRQHQPFVAIYADAFDGIHELCYMLKKWGEEHDLFSSEFSWDCLNALLLLHGIDGFPKARDNAATEWLEKIKPNEIPAQSMSLFTRIGGLGTILMEFFKYLGSRDFKQFSCISLTPLHSSGFLTDAVCAAASRAAYHTYYHITFSGMFDSLPQIKKDYHRTEELTEEGRRLYELEPFTVELPFGKELEYPSIIKNLKKMTSVHHLAMRKMKDDYRFKTVKLIVSGVGTLDSLEKLREVVSIKPNMRSGGNCIIPKANLMADMVYEKIRCKRKKVAQREDQMVHRKFDLNMISDIGKVKPLGDRSGANREPFGERGPRRVDASSHAPQQQREGTVGAAPRHQHRNTNNRRPAARFSDAWKR